MTKRQIITRILKELGLWAHFHEMLKRNYRNRQYFLKYFFENEQCNYFTTPLVEYVQNYYYIDSQMAKALLGHIGNHEVNKIRTNDKISVLTNDGKHQVEFIVYGVSMGSEWIYIDFGCTQRIQSDRIVSVNGKKVDVKHAWYLKRL